MPLGPPYEASGIRTRRRGGNGANNATRLWAPSSPSTIPQFLAGQTEENRVYSPSASTWRWPCWPSSQTAIAASRYWTCWMYRTWRPCEPGPRPCGSPLCERWGHHLHSGFFVMAESRRNLRPKHLGHPVQNLLCLHLSGKKWDQRRPTRPCGVGSTSRPVGFFRSSGGTGAECRNGSCPATTVYFRAKWASEFSLPPQNPVSFTAVPGFTCDFMKSSSTQRYCRGEAFSAVYQPLEGGGRHVAAASGCG